MNYNESQSTRLSSGHTDNSNNVSLKYRVQKVDKFGESQIQHVEVDTVRKILHFESEVKKNKQQIHLSKIIHIEKTTDGSKISLVFEKKCPFHLIFHDLSSRDNFIALLISSQDSIIQKSVQSIPLWMKNKETKVCMCCNAKFTLTRRKHHCRACGQIICARCSPNVAVIGHNDSKNLSSDMTSTKQLRVCNTCYDRIIISRLRPAHELKQTSSEPLPIKTPKMTTTHSTKSSACSLSLRQFDKATRLVTFGNKTDEEISLMLSPETASRFHLESDDERECLTEENNSPVDIQVEDIAQEAKVDTYGFVVDQDISEDRRKTLALQQQEIRNRQLKNWKQFLGTHTQVDRKDRVVKKLVREGIPPEMRGRVWQLLVNAKYFTKNLGNDYYQNLLDESQKKNSNGKDVHIKQIEKDLVRTFPTNVVYKNPEGEGISMLRRILTAYATRNKVIGYCQSLNYIVALLLLFMEEIEAFWMLVFFIENIARVSSDDKKDLGKSVDIVTFSEEPDTTCAYYYQMDMAGIQIDQQVFIDLVAAKLPKVHKKLEELTIPLAPLTINWFLCIFVHTLPLECVLRVWDCVFSEGIKIIFRAALTLLKINEKCILQAPSMEQLMVFLKSFGQSYIDADAFIKLMFKKSWIGSFPIAKIHYARMWYKAEHDKKHQKVKDKQKISDTSQSTKEKHNNLKRISTKLAMISTKLTTTTTTTTKTKTTKKTTVTTTTTTTTTTTAVASTTTIMNRKKPSVRKNLFANSKLQKVLKKENENEFQDSSDEDENWTEKKWTEFENEIKERKEEEDEGIGNATCANFWPKADLPAFNQRLGSTNKNCKKPDILNADLSSTLDPKYALRFNNLHLHLNKLEPIEKFKRCEGCGKVVTRNETCLYAMDKIWHPDHFRCHGICGKSLSGVSGFYKHDGKAYCKPDYLKKYGRRCGVCKQYVLGGTNMESNGILYHNQCVACSVCGRHPNDTISFYQCKSGKFYCNEDYKTVFSKTCDKCGKLIIGSPCLTVQKKNYHSKCLLCGVCKIPLENTGSKVLLSSIHENVFYCASHKNDRSCQICGEPLGLDPNINIKKDKYHSHCQKKSLGPQGNGKKNNQRQVSHKRLMRQTSDRKKPNRQAPRRPENNKESAGSKEINRRKTSPPKGPTSHRSSASSNHKAPPRASSNPKAPSRKAPSRPKKSGSKIFGSSNKSPTGKSLKKKPKESNQSIKHPSPRRSSTKSYLIQKDPCPQCKQPILGNALLMKGKRYHKKCIVCKVCGMEFPGGAGVYSNKNNFYCKEHYMATFITKCSKCNEYINNGRIVSVMTEQGEMNFHSQCFLCSQCSKSLIETPYRVRNSDQLIPLFLCISCNDG